MSHRIQPGLVLPRSPLIFVLAQVRIGTVLTIAEKIPAIQEALRKQGFPRFQQRSIETTRQQAGGITQIEQRPQWEFVNRESTLSILIEQECVVLQSTAYTAFESYLDSLRIALDIVAALVEPALVERLGLRYVDLIVPTGDKSVADYVRPALLGAPPSEFGQRKAFLSESVITTESDSQLMIRFVEGNRGFAFPPDLLPVSLKFHQDPARRSPFGLFDLDHSSEKAFDFAPATILSGFWHLHALLEKVFKTSVTDSAIEEWSQP